MKRIVYFLAVFLLLSGMDFSYSKEYKVDIGQLAPEAIEAFTNLSKAITEVTGNTIVLNVVPPIRGLHLIETKEADFYGPYIALKDPKKIAELKFDYSTVVTHQSVWILFINKNLNIDVNELKNGNPKNYKIETDISVVDYFNFNISSSTNIESSLKKVDSGRIDGYIFSQAAADAVLKKSGLKNIKRIYYDTYDGNFVIAKGTRGGEIDRMLSSGIDILKKNGRYDKIMAGLMNAGGKFIEWQP